MSDQKARRKVKITPIAIVVGVILLFLGVYYIVANDLNKSRTVYKDPDEIPRVSVEEAYQAIQNGEAILVDTRPLSGFNMQHAAGAISLPYEEIERDLGSLDPDRWYILYCT